MKTVVMMCTIFLLSGCCSNPKSSINQYADTIHEQAQSGLEELKRCKNGDQPACTALERNLNTVDNSAKEIRNAVQK